MMILIHITLWFLPCFSLLEHDFKMSVCEVVYVEEKTAFEVKFYIFQDDLKEAVYGNPLAELLERDSVEKYLEKHFSLYSKDQKLPLNFQLVEEKSDQIRVTLSSAEVPLASLSKIAIKNTILIEQFPKQTNMVYVILPEQAKLTGLFNRQKKEMTFIIR